MPVVNDMVSRKGNSTDCSDAPGDATWILTSSFIIFTMQSGFGLLEAGMVSQKNEANIMVKNAVDVIFGGLSYWLFGFGLSFGDSSASNAFTGVGYFATDAPEDKMGDVFSKYIFQLSFATTATTIVSGAMAERTNLKGYMVYSFFNTISYCFPAHWIWGKKGFLRKMNAVDIAGCAPVHVVGGVSALIAAIMLKPRHGRFTKNDPHQIMSSPTNVMLGTFMLWWGWLGFNTGSTFGISGQKWKLASRAAVVTINGSIGGAIYGIFHSYVINKKTKGKLSISTLVTGIIGGLVSITAICAICRPWEGLLIGFIGGIVAVAGDDLIKHIRVDDPVGCISTHFFGGTWGMIAVALFAEKDVTEGFSPQYGITKGGPVIFLGVQALAIVSTVGWASLTTFIILFCISKTIGLRVPLAEEIRGADWCEHGIPNDDTERWAFGKRVSSRRQVTNENDPTPNVMLKRRVHSKETFSEIEEPVFGSHTNTAFGNDNLEQRKERDNNSLFPHTSNTSETPAKENTGETKKRTIETFEQAVSVTHSAVILTEHGIQ